MHKMTKACAIPKAVKAAVYERDGGCCILCGSNQGQPVAHFIPRSHGGLGIEENVVTLCNDCHHQFDNSDYRSVFRRHIQAYLVSKYPNWDESNLIYRKWGG